MELERTIGCWWSEAIFGGTIQLVPDLYWFELAVEGS